MTPEPTPPEVQRCREYDQAFSDRVPILLRRFIVWIIVLGIILILLVFILKAVIDGKEETCTTNTYSHNMGRTTPTMEWLYSVPS